jgi:hypothetical protein
MEKAGESRGGRGSYIDKTRNRKAPLPPPTTPLLPVCATRLCIELCFNYTGRRTKGGAIMSGPLVNDNSQTTAPFQVPFIVLLHGWGAIFNLQPSSPPPTSILVANFIPLQLQSSLPTSSLVAANFNPRRLSISKPRRRAISSPSPWWCPRYCACVDGVFWCT